MTFLKEALLNENIYIYICILKIYHKGTCQTLSVRTRHIYIYVMDKWDVYLGSISSMDISDGQIGWIARMDSYDAYLLFIDRMDIQYGQLCCVISVYTQNGQVGLISRTDMSDAWIGLTSIMGTQQHLYHMFSICLSHIQHMSSPWLAYLHRIISLCLQPVQPMFTECLAYYDRVFSLCVPHVQHMIIACLCYVLSDAQPMFIRFLDYFFMACLENVYRILSILVSHFYPSSITLLKLVYHIFIICVSQVQKIILACLAFGQTMFSLCLSHVQNLLIAWFAFDYRMSVSYPFYLALCFVTSLSCLLYPRQPEYISIISIHPIIHSCISILDMHYKCPSQIYI